MDSKAGRFAKVFLNPETKPSEQVTLFLAMYDMLGQDTSIPDGFVNSELVIELISFIAKYKDKCKEIVKPCVEMIWRVANEIEDTLNSDLMFAIGTFLSTNDQQIKKESAAMFTKVAPKETIIQGYIVSGLVGKYIAVVGNLMQPWEERFNHLLILMRLSA